MEISIANLLGPVLMVGLRVSGLLLFAPFFSHASIPPRIKAVLVIGITAILYPVYSARLAPVTPSQWPLAVASEMLVGIAIGLSTNAVFEAAQIGGQMLSVQMGYSLVNILDPATQVESTVVAMLHQSLIMLIFLSLGVHRWILRAIAHSFEYLPPGTATLNPILGKALLHEGTVVLQLGVQIAAPVLGATLLVDLLLGLLGKASPQMPLMLLGPAIKSTLGVTVFAVTIGFWPRLFEKYFSESIMYAEQLLHVAR
ncbi:MAG TPA: flagellar biosynthetic protein FliR [Terriglobales bacterium]|jgi:flagellar biosynthetic protein FliR|nr:flagellar biosynthetic protein FliR [Terriglobales bacterium]